MAGTLMVLGLLAAVIGLRLALEESARSSEWVVHTERVIATAQALARAGSDAQTGMRGYLLSGEQSFLEPFDEGLVKVSRHAGELRQLVSDRPDQVRRVESIEASFFGWHREVAVPLIAARGRAEPGHTLDLSTLREGKRRMDVLREQVEAFIAVESGLLEERRSTYTRVTQRVMAAATLGLVLAMLLASSALFRLALRVTSSVRELSQAAEAFSLGDLSRRTPVRGQDEFATLAHAFNVMAERLDGRSRDQAALKRLRDMLQASHSSHEVYQIFAQLGPLCLEGAQAELWSMRHSRNLLDPAVGWGAGNRDEPFSPDECWALRSGRAHATAGAPGDVVCAHRRGKSGASVCLPLVAQGETVGLLCVEAASAGQVPSLATEVGEVLSLTMANLRLREALHQQAVRDPLTGLYNRRYLEETFLREVARASRGDKPISVLVLDVDHFKRFNDTHGHGGGDALLKHLGAALREQFRADDVPCRYGGEEFVVLLPNCPLEGGLERAEALRRAVQQMSVRHDGVALGPVTVSIGVAAFPRFGADLEALLEAADRALYAAKRGGRNRVVVASESSAPAEPEPKLSQPA